MIYCNYIYVIRDFKNDSNQKISKVAVLLGSDLKNGGSEGWRLQPFKNFLIYFAFPDWTN